MLLPGTIVFDFTTDPSGTGLMAKFSFRGADGTVYDQADAVPIAAGTTLMYGPVSAEITFDSVFSAEPTPPSAKAAAVTPPHPPGKPGAPTPPKR